MPVDDALDLKPTAVEAFLDVLINQPLVAPETPDGIGPTLGQDLTPEHARSEDAKYRPPQPPAPR